MLHGVKALWTEQYRPRSLSEIRGQDAALSAMQQWARSWERGNPKKKALLLHGPAGTGKTASASALGKDMGWDSLEINASDRRSQLSLEETIKSSRTRYNLLTGPGLRLYIIDEVDGLSGSQDRGGVRAISQMISKSVNPIILICNDYYSAKLRSLRRVATGVQFSKPRKASVQAVLSEICRREGVTPDLLALNHISEKADGDIRSAINDLEAISMSGRVSREDLKVPGYRKTDSNIHRVLDLIFEGSPESVYEARELDMRPDEILDWIAENAHLRFTGREDRARAYEMISTADIYLAWVHRRMHWGFWGYATDIMTRGLGSMAELRFPHYLRKYRYSRPYDYIRHRAMMGRINRASESDEIANELDVARVIGDRVHMSTTSVIKEFLPYLRIIQDNDPEMAASILRSVGVGDEEMCDLPYG